MLLMGKSTISMAIFNSKLLVYQRVRAKFKKYPLVMTNIAMENRLFVDGLPIKNI